MGTYDKQQIINEVHAELEDQFPTMTSCQKAYMIVSAYFRKLNALALDKTSRELRTNILDAKKDLKVA